MSSRALPSRFTSFPDRAVRTDRLRRFLRADAGHPGSRVSAGCSTGRCRTGSRRGSRRPRPDVRRRQAARVAVLRRVAGADRRWCRRLPHRRQPRRHDDPFGRTACRSTRRWAPPRPRPICRTRSTCSLRRRRKPRTISLLCRRRWTRPKPNAMPSPRRSATARYIGHRSTSRARREQGRGRQRCKRTSRR